MKNIYEAPFAEFEEIETEDVILTSGDPPYLRDGYDLPEDELKNDL